MSRSIQIGSRVYLKVCVAGEPGVVHRIDGRDRVHVEWPDMPELGRWTKHNLDALILDEAYTVHQLGLAFDGVAA